MWVTIAGLVSILAAFVTWWFKTESSRRREKLLKQIRSLELEVEDALEHNDAERLTLLNRELLWLRQEFGDPSS